MLCAWRGKCTSDYGKSHRRVAAVNLPKQICLFEDLYSYRQFDLTSRNRISTSGIILYRLASFRAVVLDTTGSITSGPALVQSPAPAGHTDQKLLTYAASLEQASAHVTAAPLS